MYNNIIEYYRLEHWYSLLYYWKIDIEIYRCVTADMTSDVIITQQQIEHIQRTPNDYERYFKLRK